MGIRVRTTVTQCVTAVRSTTHPIQDGVSLGVYQARPSRFVEM